MLFSLPPSPFHWEKAQMSHQQKAAQEAWLTLELRGSFVAFIAQCLKDFWKDKLTCTPLVPTFCGYLFAAVCSEVTTHAIRS